MGRPKHTKNQKDIIEALVARFQNGEREAIRNEIKEMRATALSVVEMAAELQPKAEAAHLTVLALRHAERAIDSIVAKEKKNGAATEKAKLKAQAKAQAKTLAEAQAKVKAANKAAELAAKLAAEAQAEAAALAATVNGSNGSTVTNGTTEAPVSAPVSISTPAPQTDSAPIAQSA